MPDVKRRSGPSRRRGKTAFDTAFRPYPISWSVAKQSQAVHKKRTFFMYNEYTEKRRRCGHAGMRISVNKLLSYGEKIAGLSSGIKGLEDHRRRRGIPHGVLAFLCFCVVCFQWPSLHCVVQQERPGMLKRLRHLGAIRQSGPRKGKGPSRDALEAVASAMEPTALKNLLVRMLNRLKRNGIFRQAGNRIDGLAVAALDGVETIVSKGKRCASCLSRTLSSGVKEYFHRFVVCATVGGKSHFVLGSEALHPRDGILKEEGELTGAKRLIDWMHTALGHFADVLVMDALYQCAPIINLVLKYGMDAVIRMEDETRLIYKDAMGLFSRGKGYSGSFATKSARGKKIVVDVFDLKDFEMANVTQKLRVLRFVEWDASDPNKMLRTIMCVTTSMTMRSETVYKIMLKRWDIENNAFWILKNQWNVGHCYCHSAIEQFMLLTILAFNLREAWLFQHHGARFPKSGLTRMSITEELRDNLLLEKVLAYP